MCVVCVCVCVCVCAGACVRAYIHACVRAHVRCVCVSVCVRATIMQIYAIAIAVKTRFVKLYLRIICDSWCVLPPRTE